MKLKIKQYSKHFYIIAAFLVIVSSITGSFLFSKTAEAAQASCILPADVKFNLTVSNNFFRATKDGDVSFSANLQLITPASIQIAGLFKTADCLGIGVGGTGDKINALNIGIVSKNQNSQVCKNDSLFGANLSGVMLSCDFPYISGNIIENQTIQAGQTYNFTVTIDAAARNKLGINNVTDGQSVNELYVYPYFGMNDIAVGGPNTLVGNSKFGFSPAKSVFLQIYNSQQDLTSNQNSPPPASVAGNAPVQSSPNGGPGGGLLGFINQIISTILGLLQELIYLVFYVLIAPLIEALLKIHPYTDAFVAIIYPGWIVVRNICSIFFILALIVIAMATLFRVESYQYRHLLVQLIIAALLIFFSLVIAQSILGLADTVQGQFLGNNITQVRDLAKSLMTRTNSTLVNDYINKTGQNGNAVAENQTVFTGTIQSIFWLALSTGTFAVFLAICAFLFIRIVALWILLLISPIAYACGVLPSTAQYRSKWWQEFLKYAFFTPIMAFFLNMAAVMANNAQHNPVFSQVLNGTSTLTSGSGALTNSLASLIVSVASDILLLVFLLVSLKVAEQAGIYGAKGITDLAQKGIFAPFALAGKGLKAAGNRGLEAASDLAHIELDPRIWQHEIGEYLKKKKRDRQLAREERKIGGVPTGSPRDMLENYANLKGLKRVWDSKFGLRGFRHNMRKAGELEDEKDLLTDDEVQNNLNSIDADRIKLSNLQHLKDNLDNGVVSNIQAKQIRDGLIAKATALTEERRKLNAIRTSLVASGKSTADVDRQIADLSGKITEFTADARRINTDISSGAMDIDVKSVLNGANADEVKAGIFDQEQESLRLRANITGTTEEMNRINDDLVKDTNKKTQLGVNSWSAGQQTAVRAEYAKFKSLAEQAERPEAYYARAARIEREEEEGKKIAKIHDEGELNKLLRNARRLGDKPKAVAIIKKLTRDRNLNELSEDEGLSTSFEDTITLLERVGADLHLSDHELKEIATEIGYEAEEAKQYNYSRLTWVDPKTGHLDWNGYSHGAPETDPTKPYYKQHTKHVITEARKSEPRKRAGDLPRWTYGDEHYDKNLGRRVFELNDVGIDLLLDYASPGQERWAREQFNTWSAAAAESDPQFEQKLRARAAQRGLDKLVEDPTRPGGGKVNFTERVIENIHFVGKGEYGSKK